MKKGTHPESHDVTVRCACGHSFKIRSTSKELKSTLCSACHPYFTGTQKFVDTAGRIEKFESKYKKAQEKPKAAVKAENAEKPKATKKAKK